MNMPIGGLGYVSADMLLQCGISVLFFTWFFNNSFTLCSRFPEVNLSYRGYSLYIARDM